ncbi:MAG TPA: hypothetical protein VFT74_03385, partial [Isosphaeraceae bacterium]|nr:hypothetical protein [Isosphaeraceae bacterium]
ATRPGDHGRTPEIIAELVTGFDYFLRFAVETQSITQTQADDYRADVWDGLLDAADGMRDDHQDQSDPADQFLGLLVSSLSSGATFLDDAETGDVPEEPGYEQRCGWHQELKWQGNEVGQIPYWVHGPNAKKIGWIDTKEKLVYLDPITSYNAAAQMLRDQGDTLPARTTLQKLLHSARKLARTDSRNTSEGRNRLTCRVTIRGQRHTVLALRAADLWGDVEADAPELEAEAVA